MKFQKQQRGFTMIELVMVIVAVGILGATALPRLANTQANARLVMLNSALGALNTAMTIVYSKAMLANQLGATGSVSLGTTLTPVTTVWGYPDATAAALNAAVNFQAGTFAVNTGKIQLLSAAIPADCALIYTPALSATLPATATMITTGC